MKTAAPPYGARPPTSNVVDADVLRTQRRSDRKLAQLLGITVAREDGLPSPAVGDEDDDVALNHLGEAGEEDANHPQPWRPPAAWSSYTSDGSMEVEEQPLIDRAVADQGDERSKSKTRQKFAGLFPFRRRNRELYKTPRLLGGRATRPSLVPKSSPPSAVRNANPFGDEHAVEPDADRGGGLDDAMAMAQDEQMQVDTHQQGQDGSPVPTPIPATPSSGEEWATFPSLAAAAAAAHTVSAPTTPKRSPRRRSPGSAKSWLSEVSNASALSTSGSLRRKSVRRRARLPASTGHEAQMQMQMRSMRKTVQVLGPEAAGAVVKGTGVSPNKLRYMDFGRQLRGYMKRRM